MEDCHYDYVLVDTGSKKKTFCGNDPIQVLVSRLNKMVIHFQTDGSHTDKGFRAVYETSKHFDILLFHHSNDAKLCDKTRSEISMLTIYSH